MDDKKLQELRQALARAHDQDLPQSRFRTILARIKNSFWPSGPTATVGMPVKEQKRRDAA